MESKSPATTSTTGFTKSDGEEDGRAQATEKGPAPTTNEHPPQLEQHSASMHTGSLSLTLPTEQCAPSVGETTISTRDTTGVFSNSAASHPTVSTSHTDETSHAGSDGGEEGSDRPKKKKKSKKEKKEKKHKKEKKRKHDKKHKRKERALSDEGNEVPGEDSGVCSVPLSIEDELEPPTAPLNGTTGVAVLPGSAKMSLTASGDLEVRVESNVNKHVAPEEGAKMLTDMRKKPPLKESDLDTKPAPVLTRRDSNTRIDSSKTAVTDSSTIPTTSSSSREQGPATMARMSVKNKPVSLSSIMAEQEAARADTGESAMSGEDEMEEDRMLRMAMELSLKEYEQMEATVPSMATTKRRATEPVLQRVSRRRDGDRDDVSYDVSEASSQPSGMSSGDNEATEVVVDSPMHGQTMRRTAPGRRSEPGPRASSFHSFTREEQGLEQHLNDEKPRSQQRMPPVLTFDELSSDHLFADDDPKDAWFDNDDPKSGWFADYAMHTFSEAKKVNDGEGNLQRHSAELETRPAPDNVWNGRSPGAAAVEGMGSTLDMSSATAHASIQQISDSGHISLQEAAMIEKALREADEAEYRKNFHAALQLQDEEARRFTSGAPQRYQGNVRTMTREEHALSQASAFQPPVSRYAADGEELTGDHGFRMNAARPSESWARTGRDTIVGPNNEVRTKHDIELHARSNAHRLGFDDDEGLGLVGNQAFNSFKQSMQRRTVKGVAAHGHGRATADTDRTSGGMDSKVRHHIAHAINKGLIDKCNGVINEGKEAVIYHAKKGKGSGGFDVAIKVFKRIQEFKGRGVYVDGDPRYEQGKFRSSSSREQLELWAEKEFRNLLRANRAGVPVPTPLLHKENVVFMRFLGEDGWAVPQLKELKLRPGSSKWIGLYSQVMIAVRRLFHGARLVHGDLSEYNILVSPAHLVENCDDSVDPNDSQVLQAVLIDFGQAVDWRHPSASDFLKRDLTAVHDFFKRTDINTLDVDMAMKFVTAPESDKSDADSLSLATENSSKRQTEISGDNLPVSISPQQAVSAPSSETAPIRRKPTPRPREESSTERGVAVAVAVATDPHSSHRNPVRLKPVPRYSEEMASPSSRDWGHESLDSTEWTANFDDDDVFKKER